MRDAPTLVMALKSLISFVDISPKETSIERCRDAIDTMALDKEMLLSDISNKFFFFSDFIKLTIDKLIFENAYKAIAIIIIS